MKGLFSCNAHAGRFGESSYRIPGLLEGLCTEGRGRPGNHRLHPMSDPSQTTARLSWRAPTRVAPTRAAGPRAEVIAVEPGFGRKRSRPCRHRPHGRQWWRGRLTHGSVLDNGVVDRHSSHSTMLREIRHGFRKPARVELPPWGGRGSDNDKTPQAAGSECCRDHIDLRARGGCFERQLERVITT